MESWFPTIRWLASRQVPLPSWWPLRTSTPQRRSLLRLIAVSAEENLPLIPLIENLAQDERGAARRGLLKLARLLQSGRSLPEAIEETPGLLDDEELLTLRFDAQLGTRTAAMRQWLQHSRPDQASPASQVRGDLFYAAIVTIVGLIMILFVQLKIVPVLQRMFQDFDQPVPSQFQWSIEVTRTLGRFWWLIVLGVFAALWCIFSTQAGRFLRRSIFDRLLAALRDLHAADVLQKIGIASAAGRPIQGVLSTLARYYFIPAIRHKLLYVRNEVEQGAEVWHSLQAVGLLTDPEIRLLKTAQRVGNGPWILQQLADVKKRRTERQLDRMASCVLPILVVALGGMVLFHALTVLVPLVKLIEGRLS